MLAKQDFRYDLGTDPARPRTTRDPQRGVAGEIKPHTERGISEGVTQLRKRKTNNEMRGRTPILVTYRAKAGAPGVYEVLIADRTQLEQAINSKIPSTKITGWRLIGEILNLKSTQSIPIAACPSALGQLLEEQIRRRYARWIDVSLPSKKSTDKGFDIEHEMVAFLRELAAELESELEGW